MKLKIWENIHRTNIIFNHLKVIWNSNRTDNPSKKHKNALYSSRLYSRTYTIHTTTQTTEYCGK